MADLPDSLIRVICGLVVAAETPANRVLSLTALCGVCRRWRHELAGQVSPGAALAFDGADTGGQPGGKATAARFRKADVTSKRATFLGAAKLLHGERGVRGGGGR